jgi:hypothetical protein
VIATDMAELLAEAAATYPHLDLDFQVNVTPAQTPEGAVVVIAQVLVVCASPLIGQHVWDAIEGPVEPMMAALVDDDQRRRFMFELTQRLEAMRAEQLKVN